MHRWIQETEWKDCKMKYRNVSGKLSFENFQKTNQAKRNKVKDINKSISLKLHPEKAIDEG